MDITPNIKITLLDLRTNLRLIRTIKTLAGDEEITADKELLAKLKTEIEALKTEIAAM